MGNSLHKQNSKNQNLFIKINIIALLILLSCTSNTIGQSVSINATGALPDTSAILDIKSSSKGILIPRLSMDERLLITSPANGLLVYDTTSISFWFFDSDQWNEIAHIPLSSIQDKDLDTYIDTEPSIDADTIVFAINGVEKMRLSDKTLAFLNNKQSVFIGEDVGDKYIGLTNRNVGIGYQSISNLEDGNDNVSLGYRTLNTLKNGNSNVALGYRAMGGGHSNANFNNNVAVGRSSLFNHKNGDENVAIGTQAMLLSDSSHSNVAIGYNALRNLDFGYSNIAIGNRAMNNNKIGENNVAIGDSALYYSESNWNVAIGSHAGQNNLNGISNTYIGRRSGMMNLGTSNVMFGNDAGQFNSIGSHNTFLGTHAGLNNNGSSNIFIGSGAGRNETGSQKLYIENSSSSSPLIYGDFFEEYTRFNGKLFVNTDQTSIYQMIVKGDPNKYVLSVQADTEPGLIVNSVGNVGIGQYTSDSELHILHENQSNNAGLKIENEAGNFWRLYTRSSNGSLRFYSTDGLSGSCGNGGGSEDYVAWVSSCSGTWNSTSDRRKKKNLIPLTTVLPSLMDLDVFKYHFISESENDKKHIGLIAQDVDKYFPELVNFDEEADLYTMNYDGFGPIALKAVQEMYIENKKLSSELEILQQEMTNYKLDLEFLKSELSKINDKMNQD